jgi:hypothetical protein
VEIRVGGFDDKVRLQRAFCAPRPAPRPLSCAHSRTRARCSCSCCWRRSCGAWWRRPPKRWRLSPRQKSAWCAETACEFPPRRCLSTRCLRAAQRQGAKNAEFHPLTYANTLRQMVRARRSLHLTAHGRPRCCATTWPPPPPTSAPRRTCGPRTWRRCTAGSCASCTWWAWSTGTSRPSRPRRTCSACSTCARARPTRCLPAPLRC